MHAGGAGRLLGRLLLRPRFHPPGGAGGPRGLSLLGGAGAPGGGSGGDAGGGAGGVAELNRELEAFFGGGLPDRAENVAEAAPGAGPSGDGAAAGGLTHVDEAGRAAMVGVGAKAATQRRAGATARVLLGAEAFRRVAENRLQKGDVLTVAKIAGISAAKQTAGLIPLCHNVPLSEVSVDLALDREAHAVRIYATAEASGPTGVEMEALTAATVAGLTVYDMCKAVTKDIRITDVVLQHKSGGKSADFVREG